MVDKCQTLLADNFDKENVIKVKNWESRTFYGKFSRNERIRVFNLFILVKTVDNTLKLEKVRFSLIPLIRMSFLVKSNWRNFLF